LREPRPTVTDREKLRAALEQRVATWKADLRSKPQIARRLVKHLLGGFSAHVGERIGPQDKQRLLDTAPYLVRNPLSLKKLVYLDAQQAVLYRSKLNPFLGRNFEALDPLDWLARMSDHIVRPRTAPHTVLRRVRESCPG
jgi:hypothetical protein